jgi:hypothetical protein
LSCFPLCFYASDSDEAVCETKNQAPIIIARRHKANNNNGYKGALGDVRIYNRDLSEDEIKLLFEEK